MPCQGPQAVAQVAFVVLEGAGKVLRATRHPSLGPPGDRPGASGESVSAAATSVSLSSVTSARASGLGPPLGLTESLPLKEA